MYFAQAYNDDSALTLSIRGEMVSSLLLQPYAMTFLGHTVAAGYISGAATRPQYRRQGHMLTLLHRALNCSYSRGDMLCSLIPAGPALSRYYAASGFIPTFPRTVERYSKSTIGSTYGFTNADITDIEALYRAYSRLCNDIRPCRILHDKAQFATVMADNELSDGRCIALCDGSRQIAGILWAIPDGNCAKTLRVIDLVYSNTATRSALLHELQRSYPSHNIDIYEPTPQGSYDYGMARIVNAQQALTIVAERYPKLQLTIGVTDPLIAANNTVYSLHNGTVTTDGTTPDISLSIDQLTSQLFSSNRAAADGALPGTSPVMALMLE